ncbi:hypothetical protein GCM10022244_56360 [Streptomyces gulbargensis]|uniref:UspA domain-containing protein n=1 Tax=Streptomyces gulbargensis TaxID=364901 RepID=A0ABP7NA92_9ACTN
MTPGRVVVGVSGSLASLAALRQATAHARRASVPLVAVLAWEPPEGETLYARHPDRAWARLWAEDARLRLARAVEDGLGRVPDGPAVELRTVRAAPVTALCALARPDDLLVLGAAARPGLTARLRARPVRRGVLARAACPVLLVPGPALRPGEARVLRRSARTPAPEGTGTGVRGREPGAGVGRRAG